MRRTHAAAKRSRSSFGGACTTDSASRARSTTRRCRPLSSWKSKKACESCAPGENPRWLSERAPGKTLVTLVDDRPRRRVGARARCLRRAVRDAFEEHLATLDAAGGTDGAGREAHVVRHVRVARAEVARGPAGRRLHGGIAAARAGSRAAGRTAAAGTLA